MDNINLINEKQAMMGATKKELGQFYTTNAEYIVGDLLEVFPQGSTIIDPFAGNYDLLGLFTDKTVIGYDIDPQNENTICQDTLLNPPDYCNKWVIFNPPYLAKNKSKDKSIFKAYNTNDLYKAAIKSIIGCRGGVAIIPLNFFCDSRGIEIRKEFLSNYTIMDLKIFEEQVFDDTSYTVCAFSFYKRKSTRQKISPRFFPGNRKGNVLYLHISDGYTIGSKIYNKLSKIQAEINISRLIKGQKPTGFISNIRLRAVDSGSLDKRIKLEILEPYYGKTSDRVFATIVFSKEFSIGEQKKIVKYFNKELEDLRKQYNSLFLTNYRNSSTEYSRKRISFDLAYKIISYVISKNIT